MRVAALLPLVFFAQGCPIDPPPPVPFCGDGALNAGEDCDDGNTIDADDCHTDCSLPACGDSILDPGEVCLVGPVDVTVGEAPFSLVSGDFNDDGESDLASGNGIDESLSILLGGGAGSFSRVADVPLLGAATALVAGDFDSDGALDLAASLISGPPSVPVVRGDGAGGFSPLVTLPASLSAFSLATGDFDGDGALDLVTGDASGGGVELFLNSGRGGFLVPRAFVPGGRVSSLAAGDFDGDGAQDLAIAQDLGAGLLVLLGDGAGSFVAQPTQDIDASSLLVADLNGDGLLDLVAGRRQEGEVVPLLGDGAGAFSAGTVVDIGGALAIATSDFNQDGKLDLVVTLPIDIFDPKQNAHLAVLLGDGVGGFSAQPLLPLGFSDPDGLVAADFNGDGLPDIASTDQGGERVQLFFSNP